MMRLTHLNFVQTSTPLLGWRIVALAVGLALFLSAGSAWYFQKQVTSILEGQLAQAQPRIVLKPVGSAAEQREMEARLKTVSDAVQQLNLPVAELIKTLQPPPDIHVALLGLDLSGKGGSSDAGGSGGNGGLLKIEAEAKTPQEMAGYVAFLGDKSMFRSVYLIKHEKNPLSPENAYRFLLEAQWQE